MQLQAYIQYIATDTTLQYARRGGVGKVKEVLKQAIYQILLTMNF